MYKFAIVTDSTTDLPDEYFERNEIPVICLSCIMDGQTYDADNPIDLDEFYKKVRGGSMPSTSQPSPESSKVGLLEAANSGYKDILYIAFSTGLSGTYQSGCIARDMLKEERPELNIVVIDSLCASLGEGLLVDKAVRMRAEGASFEETCNYINSHIQNLVHVFTVDDLFHLHRGGRVSKATAIVGTMVSIKPILHVDEEGKLINIAKTRGRKKSLDTLVDLMEKKIGSYINDKTSPVFISHGDCLEDAKYVAAEVEKRLGFSDFLINPLGPVIGSHAGPGTVALFFFGDDR